MKKLLILKAILTSLLFSQSIEIKGEVFYNQSKILNQIVEMKKFNLDEKNTFIWIKDILQNETR